MATTVTSSAHLVTRAALFDELGKIAEVQQPGNRERTKRWLKNTALVTAGAGAGTAVTMVADRLIGSKLGPSWQSLDPKVKMLVIGPLVGLSTLGGVVAAKKRMEAIKKSEGG